MLVDPQLIRAYFCAAYAVWTNRGEEGSVVEKVILTAIFAAMAIATGMIIWGKVTNKVNSLDLNNPVTPITTP